MDGIKTEGFVSALNGDLIPRDTAVAMVSVTQCRLFSLSSRGKKKKGHETVFRNRTYLQAMSEYVQKKKT